MTENASIDWRAGLPQRILNAPQVLHQTESTEDLRGCDWRLPAADAGRLGADARTQLALFRAIRQARKRGVELSSQLVVAKQEVARQSARQEEQRQTLMQAGEAAEAQAQTVARLQAALSLAQQQLAESESLRLHAEAKSQAERATALDALDRRDAAVRRLDSLSGQLKSLLSTLNEERATWEHERLQTQEQTSVAQEQIISLGIRLRDSEVALQVKSEELQSTTLALANARIVMQQLVDPTKHAQVVAELSVAKQQLQQCVAERDQAVKVAISTTEALLAAKRKLGEMEAELAKKTAFIDEFYPKLKSLYARLLLIKEKQDWSL